MVTSILNPIGISLPSQMGGLGHPNLSKFTPDLSKAHIGTPLEKDKVIGQDVVMQEPGELKKKASVEAFKHPESLNLLAQAKLTGP